MLHIFSFVYMYINYKLYLFKFLRVAREFCFDLNDDTITRLKEVRMCLS